MDFIQAIALGAVQGLSEFLPISSSGHLIAVPWLLGWRPHTLSFDVMLHAGTLFAVAAYFRKDWAVLIREGFASLKGRSLNYPARRRLFWLIAVASLPAAIIGKALEEKAETLFRQPLVVAATMGGFAIVFYLIDRAAGRARDLEALNLKDAVLIGMSQALAVVPGISRSGATMACALWLGFSRHSSAKFSFLLSAPIIFGATALKLKDILSPPDAAQCVCLLLGFAVSALTGFLAIHCLLGYVRRHTFKPFVLYRVIFSIIVLSVFLFRR